MFAGFDYGPYIDPVLLDLCLKVGILAGVIIIVVMLLKHAHKTKTELERIKPPEAVPEQVLELKRQAALHEADVHACQDEIAQLKLEAEERTGEFTGLFNKYVDLLHAVEDLERRMPHIGKISITSMSAQRVSEKPGLSREPTMPPTNPKSLTKVPASSDRLRTLKLPVIKKPIPRED